MCADAQRRREGVLRWHHMRHQHPMLYPHAYTYPAGLGDNTAPKPGNSDRSALAMYNTLDYNIVARPQKRIYSSKQDTRLCTGSEAGRMGTLISEIQKEVYNSERFEFLSDFFPDR